MAVKKIFRALVKTPGEVKLAPQEAVLFGLIPATKAGIERKDLLARLEEAASGDEPKLKTKQNVSIILGYYTKHLVDSGLIEVEKIVEEPPKKEDKADTKAA